MMGQEDVIWEGEPIDTPGLLRDLDKALVEIAKGFRGDFRAATDTWEHKPEFKVFGPHLRDGDLVIEVLPTSYGDIWNYVDQGTDPHTIVPRKQGYPLRFQSGYTAKTQRFTMYSRSGGKSGPVVAAWGVEHPGIKPRHFTQLTVANHQPWWNTTVFLIFQRHAAPYAGRAGGSGAIQFA